MRHKLGSRMAGTYQSPWWTLDSKANVHQALCQQFVWLDKEQDHHRQRNIMHLRMYSNRLAATMSGASFAVWDPWEQDRLRLNVCQAVIDAAVSQAAANEIRPMPLTIGGNWSEQNKAKKLQLYFDGKFHQLRQHEMSLRVFTDAGMFGTGMQKVYPGYGSVCSERVMIDNIIVDDIEAQSGNTQTMFEYREVDRRALSTHPSYKKQAKQIEMATLLRNDHWGRHRLADPVSVVEAWRLPSYEGAEDGRHIIATSECVLLDEEWERPRFPFAAFRWKNAPIGWYGLGAIEEIAPIQIEINYLLEKKQRLLWHASYQLWVKRGTVAQSDMDNEDHAIRQFDEMPPVALPINLGVAEIDAHIENLYRKVFEITGVSMMQAQAQKPPGLNSGTALNTYNDIASVRFMYTMKRFENYHMDVAQLLLDAERDLKKEAENDDYVSKKVLAKGRNGLEAIGFDDVSIDDDKLHLQTFPTSMLPAQPAGKLQMIKDLGEISPEVQQQMVSQLDFPDTERMLSLINAPLDLADKVIDRMLEHGEYRPPEPVWNVKLCMDRAQSVLIRAEIDNAPDERLDLLRRFITECNEIVNPPPPPAAPIDPMMAQQPMAQQPAPDPMAMPQQPMANPADMPLPPEAMQQAIA